MNTFTTDMLPNFCSINVDRLKLISQFKYRHTARNMCLYIVFSQVHFIGLGILSPQKCNFVFSVMLQMQWRLVLAFY